MKRTFLMVLTAAMAVFANAQTPAALEAHRLQYKTDLHNDIKADTSLCDFFPFNAAFIIAAKATLLTDQPVFDLVTSSGKTKQAQKYVKLEFTYNGKTCTLFGYQLIKLKESAQYADYFFVPFRDLTSNKASYGAGRYLDFKAGDVTNGELVLDFNKAYNPYCAFTEGYNCPIPPKENTLQIEVTAGEKKFRGHE